MIKQTLHLQLQRVIFSTRFDPVSKASGYLIRPQKNIYNRVRLHCPYDIVTEKHTSNTGFALEIRNTDIYLLIT